MFNLNNDQASALVWFTIGATIGLVSYRYGLGVLNSPGPGFMPFLAGLSISFFSLIGFVDATVKQRHGIGWEPIMKGLLWEKLLIVLVAFFGYTLFLTILGFFLSTVLFVGILLRSVKPQRWAVVIVGSILAALGANVVFVLWLQAQLPKGPWGF